MVAAVDPAVSVRYSYAPEASDSPVAHNVRKDRGLGLANPVSPLAVARGELNGAFALHRPEGGGGSPFSSLHCRPPSSSPRERENEQPFEDQPLKKSAEHYRAALGTRQRRSGGSPLPHQPWEAGDAPSAPPHPQEAYGMWGRSPSPPPPAMPEADEMYPRVQGVDRREHRQPPPRAQGGGQGGGHRHQPRPVRMGRAKGWRMFAAYEASLQVCHQAVLNPASDPESINGRQFLLGGCQRLRSAFGIDSLLLRPPDQTAPPGGPFAVISWADADDPPPPSPGPQPGEETLLVRVAEIRPRAGTGARLLEKGKRLVGDVGGAGGPPGEEKASAILYPRARPAERVPFSGAAVRKAREADGAGAPTLEVVRSDAKGGGGMLAVELVLGGAEGLAGTALVNINELWKQLESASSGDPGAPCRCEAEITVNDDEGTKAGKVRLTVTRQRSGGSGGPPGSHGERAGGRQEASGAAGGGRMELTSLQVFETVAHAALAAESCGPRKLEVEGEWKWLLSRLAAAQGIQPHAVDLLHLQWVFSSGSATPLPVCLELLHGKLHRLLQARDAGQLQQTELTSLQRLLESAEKLLSHTFTHYRRLSEACEGGIIGNGDVSQQVPAAALRPAARLFVLLRDPLKPEDQRWLQSHLREGARWRYHRLKVELLKAGDAAVKKNGAGAAGGLYLSLGQLCQQVVTELQADLAVHESAVLPSCVNVAAVAAGEYCAGLLGSLQEALQHCPPRSPDSSVVQLTHSAWKLQVFLERHKLPEPGEEGGGRRFDTETIFGPYVETWVECSLRQLQERCHRLEQGAAEREDEGGALSGGPKCAPLVPEMLVALEAECRKYSAVLEMLPLSGVLLEKMATDLLKEVLVAVSSACGARSRCGSPADAVPKPQGRQPRTPTRAARWWGGKKGGTLSPQADPSLAGAFSPWTGRYQPQKREILLLNSLRQLLVAANSTNGMLEGWCRPGPKQGLRDRKPGANPAEPTPSFGAQFKQLKAKLQDAYTSAAKDAAERLASCVFHSAPNSIEAALQSLPPPPEGQPSKGPVEPGAVERALSPLVHTAQDALGSLVRAVDDRVLVMLTRGLWEHAAARLGECLRSPAPSSQAPDWMVLQNAGVALNCIDASFKQFLSDTLQSGLKDEDLKEPKSSTEVHQLFDGGRSSISVY